MPKMPRSRKQGPTLSTNFRTAQRAPNPQIGKPLQLDVEGFYLRSLRKSDATKEMAEWLQDPEVLVALNLPVRNITVEGLQQYFAAANNMKLYLIGIFTKPDMRLIGFYQINVTVDQRRASMHAFIGDRNWWGKGIFRKVGGPLVDLLFEDRNIDKVSLRVTGRNKRIIYSLLGTPYKHEGTLRKEILTPNGERVDIHVFARLKDKYEQ